MTTQTQVFNGGYGFVAILDAAANQKARELGARRYAKKCGEVAGLEYAPGLPHVTLYHAKVQGAPADQVRAVLNKLGPLVKEKISFGPVAVYGDKFLFWNAEISSALREAHRQALALSTFLDPKARAPAQQEGLILGEQERKNISQYGHPLVRNLQLPHITLGYDSAGLAQDQPVQHVTHIGTVERVVFACIGQYGRVEEIIFSCPVAA